MDERAEVLILGSFPSETSLAAQQYYAHKHNQFWKILGAILGQPLFEMDCASRVHVVQEAGIAIWDVYATCERTGSLDSAIRNGVPNDFGLLYKEAQVGRCGIKRICFNGQSAGKFAPQLAAMGFSVLILPSTSPANASSSFEQKMVAWRNGLKLTQCDE